MARQKEEILFEWVTSRSFAIQSAQAVNKHGLRAFPRNVAIITVLLAALYFVFDYLFPPDPSFNLLKIFLGPWLSGVVLLFFVYFVFPWICIFDFNRYRITDNGLRIVRGSHPGNFKWHNLKGYILHESKTVLAHKDIVLLTDDSPRIIHLPDDGIAEQIIQCISERLPVFQSIPPSAYQPKLTFFQKCFFVFCTLLYSGGVSCYVVFKDIPSFPGSDSEFGGVILLILLLFFGPGTICSVGMFGLLFFKNKQHWGRAIFFNVCGAMLLMLFSMILLLWKIRRDVGGW